mgnify:CR=1 FL=1
MDEVESDAATLRELSTEQGWFHWMGHARLWGGAVDVEAGRLEEGIESFSRSAELNPRFLMPQLNEGFALLRAGRYKEAEDRLAAVLEKDPTLHAAAVKLEELSTGRRPEVRRAAGKGNPAP